MLRVTKDRKRKYVSLGISVNPERWDFSKNQPKSDCPNREFIELMIAEKLKAYNSTIVDVRVIIQTALVCNATSIIITHNHPSGNPRPSIHDDNLTKKIKAACELMDIRLLDHIIVTPYDSFYSYCDEGRL